MTQARAVVFGSLVLAALTGGAPRVHAAIGPVTISGVTNTQAILTWNAPDTNTCRVEVSEAANFTPLVNDVDPAKFAGSDRDNRAGSIVSGRERTFVVGKRTSEKAADLKRYSRALQMMTDHFYRITCGADQVTGQFETQNLAFGNTFTDPPPGDENPGEFGWPTLDPRDRTQKIVDPQTGALIRRVTVPSDRVITHNYDPVAVARSAAWANPLATTSNGDGGASATIAGDSTSTLFLALSPQSLLSIAVNGPYRNNSSINYFQATLNASTSNVACNNNPTDDCKIVVCLTVDGATCRAGGYQYEQAVTATLTDYVFGSMNLGDVWQMPGSFPPSPIDAAVRNGAVTCDGSTNVTFTGGAPFSTAWGAGSGILINNVPFTIASVKNDLSLQVTTACPATPQAVGYQGQNFGVLVRKKTASADTVSIQFGTLANQVAVKPYFDYAGDFDLCGADGVLGPTGNPGYNCQTVQDGPVYWIDGVTGEAHMITKSCYSFDTNVWDPVNPDIFYCGADSISRIQYVGNHLEPALSGNTGFAEEGSVLPACAGPLSNPTNQPCLSISLLTGNVTMSQLLQAFTANDPSAGVAAGPVFDPAAFQAWAFTGIEEGKLEIRVYRGPPGASGSIGWGVIYDPNVLTNGEPNNAGCIGGGVPGCIVAATNSWTRPGCRWCALKAMSPVNTAEWAVLTPYYWGSPGNTFAGEGPYQVSVVSVGLTTQQGGAGGVTSCPANPWGATQCSTITVDGEPRDASPCIASVAACATPETGAPGEIGPALPGDYMVVNSLSIYQGEVLRLISKNGNAWIVQRSINTGVPLNSGANPILYFLCNSVPNPVRLGIAGSEIFWHHKVDPHGYNTNGMTLTGDFYGINAHYFWQNSTQAVGYTEDGRCVASPGAGCYQTRYGTDLYTVLTTPPIAIEAQNPKFANHTSLAGGEEVQQHPWGAGQNSPPLDRQFFWDGRPFNGGGVTASAQSPAVSVSGNLWKLTAAQVPNLTRKFLPTFAFAGSYPLRDISSPATGNTIGDSAAYSYQYCVAAVAGECRTGSTAGDVYVNAPYVTEPYCYAPGQSTALNDDTDLCITDNPMVYNSIMQMGLKWVDNTAKYQRSYTKALSHVRRETPFWHGHSLSNSRWMIILTSWADNLRDEIFAVKITPPPPIDGVARNTFIPVRLTLSPPASLRVDNAIAEFGYAEYGPATGYNCTTRAEACAVGASEVSATAPFFFETSEASRLTGVPCASGCTIAIPGVSQRVVYGRVVYRDSSGRVLARSAPFAVATP